MRGARGVDPRQSARVLSRKKNEQSAAPAANPVGKLPNEIEPVIQRSARIYDGDESGAVSVAALGIVAALLHHDLPACCGQRGSRFPQITGRAEKYGRSLQRRSPVRTSGVLRKMNLASAPRGRL